jgi:hypothetical protein
MAAGTKTFQVFDLLEIDGTDTKPLRFDQRQAQLQKILQIAQAPSIRSTRTEFQRDAKVALLERINNFNLEGIVLKKIDSPYRIGRQPDQFKYKFTEVSSFVITRLNEKQSVALGLFDVQARLVNCGDVKIRNRYFTVHEGLIIDVRYMHAFPQSNLVYQPRMVAIRDDLQPEACTLSQLRYKGTEITVA